MKISILLPDLRGGGVERIRIVLANEFARMGHDVEFILMQARGEFLEEVRDCFAVVDLATTRVRAVPFSLVCYLRRRRPDALLAAMWPLTVIAPLAQRLSGHRCKVLVSEHCVLSAQYAEWGQLHRVVLRASMALGYRLTAHRMGVSSGVVNDIAALAGLHSDTFNVVHNPLSPRPDPAVSALQKANALWSGPEGERIVTVGSLKAQKNYPLLLRAFARLNRPNARLMFVGDGPCRRALLSLAKDLGVADRVVFTGFHSEPTPFYKSANLFVLSSDYEGFGNVIVEALSCGLPVVSTDCPSGPAEILQGGRFGHLVPVGDATALTRAMENTLAAPVDREALICRASDFAPEIAARKYLDLLGLT